jgi:type VII secretion protein EccB
VTPRGESAATTYLLYEGRRAAVDLRSPAVVRALRLDGLVPVPVSRTLLDAVAEVPAIAVPAIGAAGDAGPVALGRAPIGTVVSVQRAESVEHYVVLRDGVQAVGEVAADLVRFAYDRRATAVVTVAPAVIAALPLVAQLPVETFPRHARPPVGRRDGATVCVQWRPGDSNTVVLSGDSVSVDDWNPRTLVQADGEGPQVDAVVVPGGGSAFVRAARIVGDDGASGARFLVSDAGVLFGIRDDDAARFLGLAREPRAAPWPVLAHLPRGPELSTDAASVARDAFPPPS